MLTYDNLHLANDYFLRGSLAIVRANVADAASRTMQKAMA